MIIKKLFLILFLPCSLAISQTDYSKYMDGRIIKTIQSDHHHFLIIGDRTGGTSKSWQIFDSTLVEINRMTPDFVVFIGDLIEGYYTNHKETESNWITALQHLEKLEVPLFIIPGNHDIWDVGSFQVWQKLFGKTYFSFQYKNCRYIFLNTEAYHLSADDGFGAQQMSFIETEIRNNQNCDQFLIFMHRPVWLLTGEIKSQWIRIETLLSGKPYSVFAGHLHALGSTRQDGHLFLISGPTGGELRFPENPGLGLFHHITRVTVTDNDCSVKYIANGQEYDEGLSQKSYHLYMQGLNLLKMKFK